jgi:hypothetical protein
MPLNLLSGNRILMIGFLFFLFFFRLAYGLCSEFWFEDELQIYLIGLKAYTTQTWPYFGPDIVYTQTQLPGALQGLLVALPLFLFPVPEAPFVLLNLLSFVSLLLFSFYVVARIPSLSWWLVVAWLMLLPWPMHYGTRIVNPSYVLVFSIPFFIAMMEVLPLYRTQWLWRKAAFILLGMMPGFLLQLHLSVVLLIPLILLVFINTLNSTRPLKEKFIEGLLFLSGCLVGTLTLLPTFLLAEGWERTTANVSFNTDNIKNLVTVVMRYFSFASFEIPYFLGGSTAERMQVIKTVPMIAPFALFLLLGGFACTAIFLLFLFRKLTGEGWLPVKKLTLLVLLVTYLSFFFSVKGPSSHTFYIVFPLVTLYSFYCHDYLIRRWRLWKPLMQWMIISSILFYTGTGCYNFKNKSLYKDRPRIEQAIHQKDYTLLGTRRADQWGYGY